MLLFRLLKRKYCFRKSESVSCVKTAHAFLFLCFFHLLQTDIDSSYVALLRTDNRSTHLFECEVNMCS